MLLKRSDVCLLKNDLLESYNMYFNYYIQLLLLCYYSLCFVWFAFIRMSVLQTFKIQTFKLFIFGVLKF